MLESASSARQRYDSQRHWEINFRKAMTAYLLDDADALRASDAGPKRQASERSIDLAERA
jgi:hypothetical protein